MNSTGTVPWWDLFSEALIASVRPVVRHSGDVVGVLACGPMAFAWAGREGRGHAA